VGVDESALRDAHAEMFGDLDWNAFSASVAAELTLEPQATRTDASCQSSGDIWTPALFPLIEQAPEEDIVALYRAGFEGAGTFNEHICVNVYPDASRYEDYEELFEADERAEHRGTRTVCHRMLEWRALEAGDMAIQHMFSGMESAVESGFGSGGWALSLDDAWVFIWLETHRPQLWRHLLCLKHDVQVEPVAGNLDIWMRAYGNEKSGTTFPSRELAEDNAGGLVFAWLNVDRTVCLGQS
jgi:hypothetical protein